MAKNNAPTLKSRHKRKRRRAAKIAIAARWKSSTTAVQPSTSSVSPSSTSTSTPHGSHIMDLKLVSEGMKTVSEHSKQCEGKCFISSEICREGLASVLEVSCNACEKKFTIESSDKIMGSEEISYIYNTSTSVVADL